VDTRSQWVELGVVARAHGVRGWVRVRLADPASTALSDLDEVMLGEPPRRVRVLEAEGDDAGYRLRLEGVEDRDAAEALRGQVVRVERAALPEPEEDEVYVADLVGCRVEEVGGRALGVVKEAFHSGAYEVLVVEPAPGVAEGECYIPFVDGIVTEVDVEGRRIVCDPPEGLLDINRRGPQPVPDEPEAGDEGEGDDAG
jgi:16S rRNA processing protein RimM